MCLSFRVGWTLCLGSLLVGGIGVEDSAYGCEMQSSSLSDQEIFRRHLIGSCTSDERTNHAIDAVEVFRALQEGRDVDLEGVTVIGDLMFDQLPVLSLNEISESSPVAGRILDARKTQNGRMILGSLSLYHVDVQGNWATNLRNDVIFFNEDVLMTETTFQQSMDFTQSVFLKSVDFSRSVIAYEGFFIRTQFDGRAIFDGVEFGTHSRFHKAQFKQDVSFTGSHFRGIAEFLEVAFTRKANFEKARFVMGTGFSGAQFDGPLLFVDAHFVREVFFRFSIFRQSANFQDATFQGVADFAHAQFPKDQAFSRTNFSIPPDFSDTVLEGQYTDVDTDIPVSKVLTIGLAFAGFLCFVTWGVRKWRESSS